MAYPGAGAVSCETQSVNTRLRTATAVLSLALAGPVVLAGCADGATSEAAASSSVATQSPAKAPGKAPAAASTTAESTTAESTDGAGGFPGNTEADTEDASPDAAVTVRDIRIGAHDGFDRVVFEVDGSGTPGWDVRFVDAATSQGSGAPVDVAGDAVLQVTLTGAGYPYATGVEEYARGSLTSADTSAVAEVVWDATFEGTSVAFIGTTARSPFRVYALSEPSRVVVEVAHAAG